MDGSRAAQWDRADKKAAFAGGFAMNGSMPIK
jgi:hypothetical protein